MDVALKEQTITPKVAGPLAGLRVLDLTWHIAGPYCTKLLADYGADVIKIERPKTGDPARSTPPFFHNEPGLESSLLFLYLNTNKRSVTLDLKAEDDRNFFLELAKEADVVVESFRPGVMERLGLGFETLHALNPRLIMTSISNFGQTGPDRDLPATELVEYAMSGLMTISGSADNAPLKHGLSQGQYGAGTVAVYITTCMTYSQALGAPGQWIDVSIQESLASELVLNEPYYAWSGGIQGRRPVSGDGLGNLVPCKDGYVVIQLAGAKTWEDIVDFLGEPALGAPEFMTATGRNLNADKLDEIMGKRLLQLGMHELFDEGTRRRLLVGMAQEPVDLLACPQLAARGYFVEVEHPVIGSLPFPGEPVKMSATPWSLRRRPPLLGEHNAEVFTHKFGSNANELVDASVDASLKVGTGR